MNSPSKQPAAASLAMMASGLDPALVHRVLLTDPSDFGSLTVSGVPRSATPTYEEFSNSLKQQQQPQPKQSLEVTMKKAFYDHVCQLVQLHDTHDMEPLQKLLLELHSALRSLVPNRSDLHHSILHDDDDEESVAATCCSPEDLLPPVRRAAQALEQLESEERSETTLAWMQEAHRVVMSEMEFQSAIDFLVTSLLYLLHKAELCESDKQDFYLATVWAPRIIHKEGYKYERDFFEVQFGKLQNDQTGPLTKEWIHCLVQNSNERKELVVSQHARQQLVKRGWIEDILFRSLDHSSLALPEILALDLGNIQSIRDATRRAAAGSALALHASNAAGVGASVLSKACLDPSSPISLRQKGIAEAMSSRHLFKTREEYEGTVAREVVALAREWNPLSGEAENSLKSRTASVLRGEDPVIRLLDGRMKEAFSSLVTRQDSDVPVGMRSGRGSNDGKTHSESSLILVDAQDEFRKRGLSFYAPDLAKACLVAKKVIDLAWTVFGNAFLDRVIVDECTRQNS